MYILDKLISELRDPSYHSGLISLICMSVCGVVSSLKTSEMVDRVNEKLPREEQFNPLGWHLPKYLRLRREYKRLYPAGPLLRHMRILMALGVACLLISAWSFRFFAR
jgi:hypothetical protein